MHCSIVFIVLPTGKRIVLLVHVTDSILKSQHVSWGSERAARVQTGQKQVLGPPSAGFTHHVGDRAMVGGAHSAPKAKSIASAARRKHGS